MIKEKILEKIKDEANKYLDTQNTYLVVQVNSDRTGLLIGSSKIPVWCVVLLGDKITVGFHAIGFESLQKHIERIEFEQECIPIIKDIAKRYKHVIDQIDNMF